VSVLNIRDPFSTEHIRLHQQISTSPKGLSEHRLHPLLSLVKPQPEREPVGVDSGLKELQTSNMMMVSDFNGVSKTGSSTRSPRTVSSERPTPCALKNCLIITSLEPHTNKTADIQ
ncbi:hypothetical protein ATANTOWER_011837, partial [Ataeniobius toweri]|nr:hypothetical protein [Ataeniobius toweri]